MIRKVFELITKTKGVDEATKEFDDLSKATNKAADSADRLDAKFEDVYENIEPLTTRMGEAEDRLYELALAGDTTSREYQQLLEKVGQYRKVQIETDLAVDAAATTLSQKLGGAIMGVSSGFAALQGVIGLVSTESEELNKILLRVQSSLALVQGIQGVREAIPAFKQLGITAANALKAIRTGIAATGVGLLVIAVGTLVAYWDDITEAISGVSNEQEKLNAETQKNVVAAQENLDTLNGQENILKLQGKSEREILKLKMAATDEMITAAQVQIEQMEQTKKAQVEAAQRNKDIAQGIITFLSAPIVILLKAVDALTMGLEKVGVISEATNLAEGFVEGAANLLFDPEETAAEADEEIKVAKKALETLKNNRAGFQLQIQAIDTAAAKKSVDTEKKRLDDIKKLQDDAFDKMVEEEKALQETFDQIKRENEDRFRTEQENEILLVEEKYDRLQAMAQGNAEALEQIEIARLNELNDINLKYQEEEEIILTERQKFAALTEDTKRNLAVGAATDTFTTISNLAELFAGESKKQQKKAFKVQKAANIAQATVDTFSSAIAAYKSQASIPVVGPVLGGIAAAAAVSAGLLNIKKISQQRFDSGGGTDGGGADFAPGGGGAQAPSFNVVGDSGVNQLAQLQQQPTQAFVVSGEVTTAQALDRNRIQNATL